MLQSTDVREVPLTRGYTAIIDATDWPLVSGHSWHAEVSHKRVTVYAGATIRNRRVSMHRLLMGEPEGLQVDHRDGDGLNNRRSNLRVATRTQNQRNKIGKRGTSSRFKGVGWHKDAGKWAAFIEKRHLGLFTDEEAAARAYDEAARAIFGDFARLNFPHEPRTVQPRLFA